MIINKEEKPVPIYPHMYRWDFQKPLEPVSNIRVIDSPLLDPDQAIFLVQWSSDSPPLGDFETALWINKTGVARLILFGHPMSESFKRNKPVPSKKQIAIQVIEIDDNFFVKKLQEALVCLSSDSGKMIQIIFYNPEDQEDNPTGDIVEVSKVAEFKYRWRFKD